MTSEGIKPEHNPKKIFSQAQLRQGTTTRASESNENTLPKLLSNLNNLLRNCQTSNQAITILDGASGGSQGLEYAEGKYHIGDYSIFYVHKANYPNIKACLEATKDLKLKSTPQLINEIPINSIGSIFITKIENRKYLSNYDKANQAGFVIKAAKESFLEELEKIQNQGISLQVLIDNACTSLEYNKTDNQIIFQDFVNTQLSDKPLSDTEKSNVLKEIKGYL